MSTTPHTVELYAENGEIRIRLVCTADPDARCRVRPTPVDGDAVELAVRRVIVGYQSALDEDGHLVDPDRRSATQEILRDLREALDAARGDTAPSEVQWGVQYGSPHPALGAVYPMPSEDAARELVDDCESSACRVMQRDVRRSAWREVQE